MNRRSFLQLIGGAVAAPIIGLPSPPSGAPAVCVAAGSITEWGVDLSWEILQEIEEKEPFRDYFRGPPHDDRIVAIAFWLI